MVVDYGPSGVSPADFNLPPKPEQGTTTDGNTVIFTEVQDDINLNPTAVADLLKLITSGLVTVDNSQMPANTPR